MSLNRNRSNHKYKIMISPNHNHFRLDQSGHLKSNSHNLNLRIPNKLISDNSKPTIKKLIPPKEKSIKYFLNEEHTIETKIKTTDKCPSTTSEKYNTP